MESRALETFLGKVAARESVIGVVGLGYVGLPLARLFSEKGFRVIGFDVESAKVEALSSGQSYIGHIPPSAITRMLATGFMATTDMSRAREADALIICVPTPLDAHHQPDMSFVLGTMDSLVPHLRAGQLVALESTTYPGTTREELLPRIERRGLRVGREVFLVFSPEREDPANPNFDTRTIPKVCGGVTLACQKAGLALYGAAVDRVVPVSSPEVAEMTKLLENIHRSVNIGLVNEMKIVCDRMGIDVLEVIDAAATKPFGFTPYYPGPGVGGHCIPVDPFYLTWKAKEFGVHTRFIELAGQVNGSMPDWVVGKIVDALSDRRKSLRGARVLVLGLAYKKDVDDVRESPAVEILTRLLEKGAQVSYSDPHVPVFPRMRKHSYDLTSTPITPETLGSFDCAVLATDHRRFDYAMIREHSRLIIDTRGVFRDDVDRERIVRA